MSSQEEIIILLTGYLKAFPNSKMDKGAVKLYARALSDIPLGAIDAAMAKLLCTLKFFPAVAEIREAARELCEFAAGRTLPTPGEAWEEAMENVRKNHVYKPWKYSCPEIEAAIRRFGKMELCLLQESAVNTARAQFMRIYEQEAAKKKKERENSAILKSLPGNKLALAMRERVAEQVAKITKGVSRRERLPENA